MKRTALTVVAAIAVVISLGAVAPASADLFDGMPTGSIMGNYAGLMNQTPYGFSGGYLPDGFGGSLMDGMPTRTFADDYNYYYNQLYSLWAATGFGSLAGLGEMNGTFQNAGDATRFWGGRWGDEGALGKDPRFLDVPNHYVEYWW